MVELSNPEWNLTVEKACQEVAKKLGLSDCKVHFELYKVLLYAKGSFFKEHRDTEKIPNMFATMVINLPSTHEGGELIIRHGTEQTQYSFAGKSKFYPEFAAFYADCYHEVLPIQSGFRLSLIYNLAIAGRVKQPALSQQEKIMGKHKRKNTALYLDEPDFDENFQFIAGYTEGGVPFGTTWVEAK